MTNELERAIQHQNIEYVKKLLDEGIPLNIESIGGDDEYDILSKIVRQAQPIEIIKLLLDYGANPSCTNSDGRTALGEAIAINRVDIASLMLKYGAKNNMEEIRHPYTLFSFLDQALMHAEIDMLVLLLDNGADTSFQYNIDGLISGIYDLSEYVWLNKNDSNTMAYLKQNREVIEKLLYVESPPYLKLEEDKYIIYENKEIDEEIQPHLLANKQKHPNKKYLYADNKSDAFVYWAYKNNLLTEPLEKAIKKYISIAGEVTAKNIGQLITSTIGHELTSDMFNVEGKPFAVSYPTVTHWWYNLHTDFNRLYQDEDNRLPRAIKSQEEFDTLMKLLDIRYAQFKSGKDFNSNQNKAELQALIEGAEPPKREVDLSWLEAHCGEDGISDNGAEIEKGEMNNADKDNIIPDDFFVKE